MVDYYFLAKHIADVKTGSDGSAFLKELLKIEKMSVEELKAYCGV
jgi:hypothetical protein